MTLPASVRRWLWRRLRRSLDPALTPGQPAIGISRYSVFQGTIRLAGAFPAPATVRHLALHLPGGERLPVPWEQGGGQVRFDATIPTPATPAETAEATLVATLDGGAELAHTGLGLPNDDEPGHRLAARFRATMAQSPQGHLLEVGARARSGIARRDWVPPGWTCSGFDIQPGPNVDVVGDAHALSRHYPADSFDAAMGLSVLEHLLMPWKVVLEVNRVLKPGALGLFVTHQTWPLHDQPWDFWRFSDAAWTALLNPATGFEIIAAEMGEPAYVIPQRCSPITAFPERPAAALASAVLFRKTGPTTLQWPVDLADILPTSYPTGA